MIARVLDFVGLLRKSGIRASTAETLDAVRAVELTGLEDPEAVRGALGATLVKRPEDRATFDELFDLYFFRPADLAERSRGAPLYEALLAAGLSEEDIERILQLVQGEASGLGSLARLGTGLRQGHLEPLLRMAGLRVDFDRMANPLQVGFFTQRLLEAMRFGDAERELAALVERLEAALGAQAAAAARRALDRNVAGLRHAVRDYVQGEFERRHRDFYEQFRRETLLDKPFSRMSAEELKALRLEVLRLCRKLRAQASLRRKVERRGRLDAMRTLRRSFATGGVPFDIRRRRRRPQKPRLVVLCDISDSVRHVSRFMLQFSYTLQDLFAKVRSFVFVSDLGETTDLFARADLDRAVEHAYAGGVVSVYANSNFGRAFLQFHDRYLDAVTGHTTVIVIGDGRNNYNPANAWCLAALGARAKRVLWLNPEPPALWGFGDSAMREYEGHCDRVEVVGNLASLARVVDSLVL